MNMIYFIPTPNNFFVSTDGLTFICWHTYKKMYFSHIDENGVYQYYEDVVMMDGELEIDIERGVNFNMLVAPNVGKVGRMYSTTEDYEFVCSFFEKFWFEGISFEEMNEITKSIESGEILYDDVV